jgi:hypothetical protein
MRAVSNFTKWMRPAAARVSARGRGRCSAHRCAGRLHGPLHAAAPPGCRTIRPPPSPHGRAPPFGWLWCRSAPRPGPGRVPLLSAAAAPPELAPAPAPTPAPVPALAPAAPLPLLAPAAAPLPPTAARPPSPAAAAASSRLLVLALPLLLPLLLLPLPPLLSSGVASVSSGEKYTSLMSDPPMSSAMWRTYVASWWGSTMLGAPRGPAGGGAGGRGRDGEGAAPRCCGRLGGARR